MRCPWQGVYGMVSNLGSLVVRLLFQPLEEGAFTAFVAGAEGLRNARRRSCGDGGRKATEEEKSDEEAEAAAGLADLFHGLLKVAALVGGVIAAFGPAYSYSALRLIYGRRSEQRTFSERSFQTRASHALTLLGRTRSPAREA